MNETEDAVRRLFDSAAEDVPPGIDLLGGVRTRSRKRVVRVRAVLAAGLAGIVAVAAAIALSAVRAPSALAQVTQAASRTAAQSYRVSSVVTAGIVPGSGARRQVMISGEFDPARDVGEETISPGVQIRFVGSYLYLPLTAALRSAWDAVQPVPLPAGKSWLRAPAPRLSGDAAAALPLLGTAIPGIGQVSPQDLLALLETASQVRQVGPASGPGWTGTAYTFAATTTLGGPLHITVATSGTVDVDQQGRVRQLDATEKVGQMVLRVRTAFGDFGIPVSVSAPPASQTATLPPAAPIGP
jgi:hypothetical protein